jgi:RNA polymerase sigma factor (sigma-70 family)
VRNRTPKPVKNGPDEAARLYALHWRLALWCYKRFFARPSGRVLVRRAGGPDAAMQCCRVALWEAARRFDPSRGGAFTTYATHCVWGQLATETARGRTGPIRLPHFCGKPCKPETRRRYALARNCVSFHAALHDPPAHDDTPQRETRDELDSVLGRLRSHDAMLLRFYYIDGRTLTEIGAVLGRTKERARQLVVRAMRHARAVAQQTEQVT